MQRQSVRRVWRTLVGPQQLARSFSLLARRTALPAHLQRQQQRLTTHCRSPSSCQSVTDTSCRSAHQSPAPSSSSLSQPSSSAARTVNASAAATAPPMPTTLGILQALVQQRNYEGCAAYYETHFCCHGDGDHHRHQHLSPSKHFIDDFCRGFAAEARDVLLLLMRVYTNLGRIDKVREVLSVGLRDLAATEVAVATAPAAKGTTPLDYATLSRARGDNNSDASAGEKREGGRRASLHLPDELLVSSSSAEAAAAAVPSTSTKHKGASSGPAPPFAYHRPSLLNASVFNAYLEALTRRNKYAVDEVTFLLDQMKAAGVEKDALTYHYLVELHVRAGYDPSGLWWEMTAAAQEHTPPLVPLPATVQTFLLRVVPTTPDPSLAVAVTKAALQHGTAVMDKRMLMETMEQWLTGAPRPAHTPSGGDGSSDSRSGAAATASSSSHPSSSSNNKSATPADAARVGLSAAHEIGSSGAVYPPEYVLWLMLELELRCVLEKAAFTQYVQRQHFTELLLRCAKCTDAATAEHVLALMDRHAVPKTADVLALVVWCWAQALEVEKTLDLVEWMALKGYLDQVDCFRKAFIDSIRYTMEQHYLMIVADSLSTVALVERALAHLHRRQQRNELVTAHTLDLIVLALARCGEERRALQLVSAYEPVWNVTPRTTTYNALLVGCSRHRSTMLHRVIYRTMVNSGVVANVFTFRVLIRQAVLAGNIDEAIQYLEEVTQHPGLRVEVEMILPILERAGRAGDVETANRVSQYSLKCDIGIDGGVLRSVMQQLTMAGQSVEVLKGQLPLHEALRSRSKTGRQRARNEVLL